MNVDTKENVRIITIAFLMGITGVSYGQSPTVGTCPVFPADNIWNTRVDHLPVSPNTAAWVNTIGATTPTHPDFGAFYNGAPNGIPYITVPGNQTKYPATFQYQSESDPGPYAIPLTAPIEGGPNGDGDRHTLAVDTGHCILYELFSAYPSTTPPSWSAGSGLIMSLTSDALRPAGWTSTDAAGLPIFPGLVRYDEVFQQGEIRHAIRFTVPQTQRAYVWPARHFASYLTSSEYPPMGARFRLTASFDISWYPPEVQIIMTAMKKYGIILADNGSPWFISGVPDDRWNDSSLHWLTTIKGAQWEAVDSSPLMADPNSGRALTIPVSVNVTPASAAVRTGTSQQFSAAVTGTANRLVTWDVNGVAGGNSIVGAISSTGLYTAPSSLPSPISVTVHANSTAAAASGYSSATVTTTNVAVLPSGATIAPSGTQQFTAQFATPTVNAALPVVTWYVNGVRGGSAATGTISATGLYTAPNTVPAQPVVKITAARTSDTLGTGSVSLTIDWP
jgi:hypothetical protein